MNKRFSEIKAFHLFMTLVKASMTLSGAGASVAAALFVLVKYEMIGIAVPLCFAIGAGAGLLLGIAVFFLQFKSARKLAGELDERYSLNDRVKTSLAFCEREDAMAAAQRDDAERQLGGIKTRKREFKNLWIFIVILAIGIAMLTAAFLAPGLPADDDEGEEPPPPPSSVEITDFRIVSLKNLIETVKGSYLEEGAKEKVVSELDGLLLKMTEGKEKGEEILTSEVVGVIVAVDGIIEEVNSFAEIKEALGASANEDAVLFGEALGSLKIPMTESGVASFKDTFNEANTSAKAAAFKEALAAAFAEAEVKAEDALSKAALTFADNLLAANDDADGYGSAKDRAFKILVASVRSAINAQYVNKTVGETVVQTLMTIFGIEEGDLPELEMNEDEKFADEDKEEEDKGGDGGLGSGETLYGSDDMIYFYEEDRYVTYGEAIDIYYARVSEMLLNGEIPEDMKKHIEDYFAALYNGTEKD